jgi:hypothetical protein
VRKSATSPFHLDRLPSAVVGVIANLAVIFAYQVFWLKGLAGPFEWAGALIGFTACVALFRNKVGVIPVVFACGLAGLILHSVQRAIQKTQSDGFFRRQGPNQCLFFGTFSNFGSWLECSIWRSKWRVHEPVVKIILPNCRR